MNFRMTHIFKKSNSCVDKLINLSMKNKVEFV